jgi:phosphatidate phosphatase APP1
MINSFIDIRKLLEQIKHTSHLKDSNSSVKVYNGYGHKNNIILYGHVLRGNHTHENRYSNNPFINAQHLLRLFKVKPRSGYLLEMHSGEQIFETLSQEDGFFKFEWQSNKEVTAGWHSVDVYLLSKSRELLTKAIGKVFIPNSTQYSFISDIDDTLLISHSSSSFKKLRLLFIRNPRSRKPFNDVVKHYQLLSLAHTDPLIPNPFFYVSSSEWNLYDYLTEFFRHNELPEGILLLNKLKRFYQLFKTGKSNHQLKFERISRIMDLFPKQQFILLGDNSQKDPELYKALANHYPNNIYAIYIRQIRHRNINSTKKILDAVTNKNIHICLFKNNAEAILHSQKIGLLVQE